jgi:hypothetical protein
LIRVVANLLLAVFSLGLITPAFASLAESNLPACCRRAGIHHCSMSASANTPTNGVGFSAAKQKCPFYSRQTAPGPGKFFVTAASAVVSFTLLRAAVFPKAQNAAIPAIDTHHQRGPPSLS